MADVVLASATMCEIEGIPVQATGVSTVRPLRGNGGHLPWRNSHVSGSDLHSGRQHRTADEPLIASVGQREGNSGC
jgi:hypothetical protein